MDADEFVQCEGSCDPKSALGPILPSAASHAICCTDAGDIGHNSPNLTGLDVLLRFSPKRLDIRGGIWYHIETGGTAVSCYAQS